MAGGLEIINPAASLFLGRVAKEEHVRRDLPRKPRDGNPERSKENPREEQTGEEAGESMSSTHIDLRI